MVRNPLRGHSQHWNGPLGHRFTRLRSGSPFHLSKCYRMPLRFARKMLLVKCCVLGAPPHTLRAGILARESSLTSMHRLQIKHVPCIWAACAMYLSCQPQNKLLWISSVEICPPPFPCSKQSVSLHSSSFQLFWGWELLGDGAVERVVWERWRLTKVRGDWYQKPDINI